MNPKLLREMSLAAMLGCLGASPGSAQSPLILDREALLQQPPPAAGEGMAEEVLPSPFPDLAPGRLAPSAFTYRVSMSLGGDRMEVELERQVERTVVDGRDCWRVVDVAATPGGEATDSFDLDAETLAPLRRVATGTGTFRLSYDTDAVTGEIGVGEAKFEVDTPVDSPLVGDGPGLELTMAALPLRTGFTTAIRFFEPVDRRVRVMQLAVTGEEVSQVPAGVFPTWVVELTSLDGNDSGTATFSVMKEPPYCVVKGRYRLPALVGGGVMSTELMSATTGPREEN